MASGIMANLPTKANPRLKFVKKAGQWCTTYFVSNDKNGHRQVQEWSVDKPVIQVG